LNSTYLAPYPGLSENDVDVNATIRKYYNVSTPFRQYGAYTRENHHSSLIMANWPNQGLIQPSHNPEDMTPGQVQYCFLHSVALNSERCQHLFAYVLRLSLTPRRIL